MSQIPVLDRPVLRRPVLRRQILGVVGALVILSLLGSSASLYRITEVSRSLDAINRVSVPVSRLLVQIQADGEVFKRELERRLGQAHWNDPHWRPRPLPRWIEEVLKSEFDRVRVLINADSAVLGDSARLRDWLDSSSARFHELMREADSLFLAVEKGSRSEATELNSRLLSGSDEWLGQLEWAVTEHDRALRQAFSNADSKVAVLRMGLEAVLVVVVSLSLLLLWLGERALRPLDELTSLARQITRRGLRREDKTALPEIALNRNDEVSSLAREFHAMATALLEREKMVESQKSRLQEQNRLLREMGEIRERLQRAEHMAVVGRMSAQVAHEIRNPLHSIGLEADLALELAAQLAGASAQSASQAVPQAVPLKQSLQSILASVDRLEKITENYLKLSKLSAGQKSVIDLGSVLESVFATYASECESKGIQVDWERQASADLRIYGDGDLLEQGLGNLFRNSLQAIETGCTGEDRRAIHCRLGSLESGRVWLRIEDTGPGIAPEIQSKLFTPFVTTKAQGTGLGLSFVKKVIEEHGGEITCLPSTPERKGACFQVLLPTFLSLQARAEASESIPHSPVLPTNEVQL